MTNWPLVSIALATFNGEKHIEQQLNSVLAQDYPNFEVVASDDGSTDKTWQTLKHYASRDRRIRLLPCRGNIGVTQNFARCFSACRGDLISPCDQDDVWHPDKTRRLVEAMGDALLVYCNSQLVDSEGQLTGCTLADTLNMIQGRDPRPFIFSNSVSGHAMVFRNHILHGHGAITRVPHDWWLAFVASNLGYIIYVDKVLVDYRRHNTSITYAAANNNSATQRRKRLAEDASRLEAMAIFPGCHQAYVQKIYDAWLAWYRSYLNPSMLYMVLREGPITHQAFLKEKNVFQLSLKYLIGNQLKRLLRPKYYLE